MDVFLRLLVALGMLGSMNSQQELIRAVDHRGRLEIDSAIKILDRAIASDSSRAELHFALSDCLLRTGQFQRGWAEYEWRLNLPGYKQRNLDVPLWDGGPIPSDGKLLVQSEQGYGDTFQFLRYLGILKHRGIDYVFQPQNKTRPLLASLPGILKGTANVSHRAPLASLPHLLSLPNPEDAPKPPYLIASKKLTDKWRQQLPGGFKVAVSWQGSVANKGDSQRSFRASSLGPLLSSGATLISLQKHDGREQISELPGAIDLGDTLDSSGAFVDTASVLANVSLLITCDTALAHLAGAMNIPTWIALAYVPDWRWGIGTESTPWYPSMRLFRQSKSGDWSSVFESIRAELQKLVS